MALKFLGNVQEAVTCPICLKFLTEPLSLDCGHSFCQTCIIGNKETDIGPEGENSCPVCGIKYSRENLWLNQHVANLVESLREVKLSPEEGQKRNLCVHHGEKLLLFCKEDRKVICWFCERSQEHRGHHTFLVEEVAQEYQEKLQATLERLGKEQQEAEKLGADIRKEITSWKYQAQTERQRIQTEFNQLRNILDSEEQRELQKLEEEEKKTLGDLAEAEDDFFVTERARLRSAVSQLLREECSSALMAWKERKAVVLEGHKIRDVGSTFFVNPRSESWTLKKPKTVSKKLKSGFRAPDLSGMLHKFKLDITLNPFNLNLNLVLSEDQRQLTSVPIWPVKYYNYGILGSQYFSSGKHYWEVDVSKKTAWILGVYCRTRSCNTKFGVRQGKNHQNVYSRFRPENGYWVVGLQNKSEYNAFEDSSTSDPKVLTLFMAVCPHRVGVFLDYEESTVSFFNITNYGSLIYKFSKCRFSQTTYPYFNPWNCPAPMILCPPKH
ncbi:Tripartite motif-containing protein 34 [Pteropus alecto]|uniref:Tripartite motif-containing protein 34 n=1 Tax=Pteropus alecto TaxID=9402 RepID=L5KFY8_PTEAL|nr:Tripartite motif-containing protein 34 [Pteropus alecto]